MSEVLRLYRYKALLGGRRALSTEDLMAKLEISRATLKRDIAKLRDQFRLPVVFDRDRGGYFLDGGHTDSELPGLWFSDHEILALVTIQQLLTRLAPGLLGPKLRPLQDRLTDIMAKHGLEGAQVAKRIRLVHAGKRSLKIEAFEAVAAATMARKRLLVTHFNRQTGERVRREISPQRLVHYRDNWYVDAWCHLREDLRAFAIDALTEADVLNTQAKEVSEKTLDQTFGGGYGIFNGAPKQIAVLKFTPERARWVRREQWHPEQEGRDEPDGSYVLSIPYSDDRELLGDILRFGSDVQALSPPELRAKTQLALLAAAGRYVNAEKGRV
ncbi:helix-turn-helix transcriptional regulator [Ramlibacter alkalitolerans]|uniref:WYL domain-containing protein n=1 Tax=Ramlibacter alkalitolerans TaxID=2039631 RepID=A0ABS1JUJ7_9BURK|nr:WYL domain-containing protein [Ramlibacter alkalitolerans]MBL0427958.1 WYL domain-containing protein [Ramlibacter alkalitolerans]